MSMHFLEKRSDKTVNSPQADKEWTFLVHIIVEAYALLSKDTISTVFQSQACS